MVTQHGTAASRQESGNTLLSIRECRYNRILALLLTLCMLDRLTHRSDPLLLRSWFLQDQHSTNRGVQLPQAFGRCWLQGMDITRKLSVGVFDRAWAEAFHPTGLYNLTTD